MPGLHTLAQGLLVEKDNTWLEEVPLVLETDQIKTEHIEQHSIRIKKRIYATQTVCALCGRPVDFSLKFPHPMSATIDHIVPVSKGGHPSDIDNLQLAHLSCNRAKADKTAKIVFLADDKAISNRILPQSMNWSEYRSK